MSIAPLTYVYEGDGQFVAVGLAMQQRADEYFAIGARYRLVEHEDRSQKSHSHYFAAIGEAWQSIPDHLLMEYPSDEHLRKKMLIQAGYADHAEYVFTSRKDALAGMKMAKRDDYAIVVVKDNVVRVYTAKSQSTKAMGKAEFQASKEAVLNKIAELLGSDLEAVRGVA